MRREIKRDSEVSPEVLIRQVQEYVQVSEHVSRICDSVLHDKLREPSRQHLDASEITDERQNLDQRMYENERRKQVEKVLADLGEKDRSLLRAKIFEELDNDKISEQFGISRANMRVVLHRAAIRFVKACRKAGLDFGTDRAYSGHKQTISVRGPAQRDRILQRYHKLVDTRLTSSLSSAEKQELDHIEKTLQSIEDTEMTLTDRRIEERHRVLMQQLDDLTTELRRFSAGGQQQSKIQ